MKAHIKSKLVLTLIMIILLTGAIAVPLSSSILHSHAMPSSSQDSWSIVPSPNPGSIGNRLNAVAAVSSNDVWAVGESFTSSGGKTLIENWNGTQWNVISSPSPAQSTNRLNGVAAVSANDIWAVGQAATSNLINSESTLIEHWDGTSWSVIPSPNPSPSVGEGIGLKGVVAISTNDVWAVGGYDEINYPYGGQTLIEHWDGTSWSIISSPNATGGSVLEAVAAVSADDVWSVGSTKNGTLTEHWNGTNWSIVPSPTPGGLNDAALVAVVAITTTDVWAIGNEQTLNSTMTLTEHWDGTSWSAISSPNVGIDDCYLDGGAGVSTSDIWAIGYCFTDSNIQTLTEHWNGTNWSIVSSPNIESSDNQITGGVAVSSNDVWAVGLASNRSSGEGQTLTEHYAPNAIPPSIIANPTQGSSGTAITVTGSNWAPGDVVDISLSTSASVLTKSTIAGDGTFSASFTVPNNAPTGTQFVNAKDETTSQTAQAPFTVTRKQLFILLQGLSSQLTIDQILNNQHPTFDDTAGIMPYLQGHGYSADTDFLEYSYPVDFPPSTPKAFQQSVLQSIHPYSCFDTFDHSLNQDVRTLDLQIRYYLQQRGHENTDVYLIGDSLGGTIGFGYLALLKTQAWSSLPNGGQLKGVITLDAPVGGIQTGNDLQAIQVAFDTKCGRLTYPPIKALNDLGSVYNTSTTDIPLGGTANMIAVIFPNFSTPTGFDNQQLADEAVIHGIRVLTIGNVKDYGYAMSGCLILNKANKLLKLQDFVSSQFVHDEGVPSGVYGRAIDKALSSICDVNSISLEINHGVVLTNSDVEQGIVSFINGNDPSPLLLPPQLIA